MYATRKQLAYAAGLFDGDGYVFIQNRKNKSGEQDSLLLRAGFRMNSERCISFISQIFGQSYSSTSRESFTVAFSADKACEFLKRIIPFLVTKRRQAALAISFQANMREMRNKTKRKIGIVGSQPVATDILEYREGLRQKIRLLNNTCAVLDQEKESLIPVDQKAAYCAGLIDAEGCIAASRDHSPQISLRVKMGDRGALDRLSSLSGSKVLQTRESTPNWESMHRVSIAGVKAADFLRTVRPYLLEKAKQSDLALEILEKISFWKSVRDRVTTETPKELHDYLHSLADQMRHLKCGKSKLLRAGAETKLQSPEKQASYSPILQDEKLQEALTPLMV